VVPVYYVLFTLSSIVGGIVLYKEYHQHCPPAAPDCHYTLFFLLGIAVTFCGVYLIAFSRAPPASPSVDLSDARLGLAVLETEGLLPPARPGFAGESPPNGYDSDVPLSPVSQPLPRSRASSSGVAAAALLGGGAGPPRSMQELRRIGGGGGGTLADDGHGFDL
jgi:hypothetical protein